MNIADPVPLPVREVITGARRRVSLDDLALVAARGAKALIEARAEMLEPQPRKRAPMFTGRRVAELCGIDRKQLNKLCAQPDCPLPRGRIVEGRGVGSREFTLAEARSWIRANHPQRPPGTRAKVVAVTGFKGGGGKTSTALHLAQGLSLLHGQNVLLVDLDSQSSATVLCDLLPEKDVSRPQTLIPFLAGDHDDLAYAVQPTYWDGLSIIPSTFELYEMEVSLPLYAFDDAEFDFWAPLDEGLEPLRDRFDFIIIDCPPSLSYLTFNAVYAADALVIPTPPEGLDFASTVMFWRLFNDLVRVANGRLKKRGLSLQKEYDFVTIVLSKAVETSASYSLVKGWIQDTYGQWVNPIEIPFSEQAKNKGVEFGSVYDITESEQDMRSVRRLRDKTDDLVNWVYQRIADRWNAEVAK